MELKVDIDRLYKLIGQLTVEKDSLIAHIQELENSLKNPEKKEFPKEVIKDKVKDA